MMFDPEWFFIGILLIMIMVQKFENHKLLNKLMSRNYQEYAQGERLKKPLNASKPSPKGAVFDPIAENNAENANRLFAL